MSLFFRIATLGDLNDIQDYERKKLQEAVQDEMEREMLSWQAKWRKESLEHYLPNGWCFAVKNTALKEKDQAEGPLVAYFLAQPLVFFEGQTQSLWVEHLSYSSLQARDELCDLAYRLSKEKHFQRVYFPNTPSLQNAISNMKPQPWSHTAVFVKTTKA